MDPFKVIHRPHSSEKGHDYIENHNTYVFEVARDATKSDIKAAVQSIWNVKVMSVRTVTMPSKLRRYGRIQGRTKPWKKAVVRVAEDQAIEALR